MQQAEGSRRPAPPFDEETDRHRVKIAEDVWNTWDPEKVSKAYAVDTQWRNRDEVVIVLKRRWARELDYHLVKELWC